ncbi:WhiB family transcriptional regulator [Streptomyces sp. NPDC101249]|uniref:WhiB family transcriptional regulator n=1 Tax=Streptomyces sp. NPDC101249 TaxID=3366140 RepID=UPI003813A4E4
MSRYAWMDQALCAQADPEAWTGGDGSNSRTARRICQQCPVRAACNQHRAHLEAHDGARIRGTWAGRSRHQRANQPRGAA